MLGLLLKTVLPIVAPILDRVIPDPKARAEAERAIQTALINGEAEMVKAAASVVRAETRGNFLQRSWRPMLMLLFGFIILNNYVLTPYANAFGLNIPTLEIPPGMWALLNIGVGGYVVGRSAEKILGAR